MKQFKEKISLVIALILLIMVGAWFFSKDEEATVNLDNGLETVTKTGNLITATDGLQDGWRLSYEEPGKPGLVIDIISKPEQVSCIGNQSCVPFFTQDKSIIGSRVKATGVLEENNLILQQIEFIDDETACNFDFQEFTVDEIYQADHYKVDFSTCPQAKEFQTRITETVQEGVNFAGKYAYAEWGCGTNCGAGAIIDIETGEIVEYGLMNTHGVEYKKNSRLLVINPPEALEYIKENDLFDQETSRYYIMQEGELLLLCEK